MPVSTSPAISVEHLSVTLGTEKVISDVSLHIPSGTYTGIVGPNGGGKTTLLRVLLGFTPYQNGTVQVLGMSPEQACKSGRIGYVPQRISQADFSFPTTVYEVVLSGLVGKPVLRAAERKLAVDQALSEVGLEGFGQRRIDHLSGGQRQRAFIARAIISRPDILFLDEPTTGVDPVAREQFYGLLRHLNKNRNMTIVFVSHDLEVMTKEASHVCCLNQQLLCCCSAHSFLEDARVQELYGSNFSRLSHTH